MLNSQEEEVAVAEQREAYNIMANILNVMHSLDHFNEEALRQLPAQDAALSHLITSLENWYGSVIFLYACIFRSF